MQMKYNAYVRKTVNLHCCKSSQKLSLANRPCMWQKYFLTIKKENELPPNSKIQETDALVSLKFGDI